MAPRQLFEVARQKRQLAVRAGPLDQVLNQARIAQRPIGEIAVDLPPEVMIGQVEADANPALVERYGVRALPTLLFFKDGALVETRTGLDRKQVLRRAILSHA